MNELARIRTDIGLLIDAETDARLRLGLLSYRPPPPGWVRPERGTRFCDIGGRRDATGVRLPHPENS